MFDLDAMRAELPELPEAKRQRYRDEYGIKEEDIESFVLDQELGTFFESVMTECGDVKLAKLASNYITSDVVGQMVSDHSLNYPEVKLFAKLLKITDEGKIGSKTTKALLTRYMQGETKDPEEIAEVEGLIQKNDPEAVKKIAEQVIAENEKPVADYKAGNENSMKFLMGQVMKLSKGSANPQMAEEILKDLLS
jgi:aspartyl-tRNA(Asn)/glutamyl-tRNA(Gln) amidotransferase subunit B